MWFPYESIWVKKKIYFTWLGFKKTPSTCPGPIAGSGGADSTIFARHVACRARPRQTDRADDATVRDDCFLRRVGVRAVFLGRIVATDGQGSGNSRRYVVLQRRSNGMEGVAENVHPTIRYKILFLVQFFKK